ncbi:staphyloferrin B biosynthesis decarboxylase SbnH [Dactylosporangium darangshiense]|uniref:Staphyloferrin B biosynthesis decarboxylase SbnH n=1 Tax=Dactylosporangium darangshiense TaxID=579108 RepID=A0ABP8DHF1_9ACTN
MIRAALQGPRPAYIYDLAVVRERVAALRAALPEGTRIAYAMKANGHPAVVRAALDAADGLEVASTGELQAATDELRAATDELQAAAGGLGTATGKLVLFSGPAKSDEGLRAAVAGGAVINVESLHELRRLPAGARICLRVNREHAALPGTHRMTGAATQFGLAEDDLERAVHTARRGGHEVLGFHLHAVSNNLDAAAHGAYIDDCIAWAQRQQGPLGVADPWVNVGGGFGVDVTGAAGFDLAALKIERKITPGRLIVEPGRFVAAEAGWYATEVVDVKRSHGTWFAVVRGGTHHFRLPASWGYSHPFTVLPVDDWPYGFERPEVRDARVTVAGEQCNPRDVLSRDEPVQRLRAGDVLLYARTGAYGWEVAHHDFLKLEHPAFTVLDPGATG